MKRVLVAAGVLLIAAIVMFWKAASVKADNQSASAVNLPVYSSDGKLALPVNYRQWVFLTSGLGMNYSNAGGGHQMFTNVFVTPEALKAFLATGKWPDKSMFVVEIYSPATEGSINKSGFYQDEFKGLDVEVKDSSRQEEWSYYAYSPGQTFAAPLGGGCAKCHNENGAVEHTFVQFYPTLLTVAKQKNVLKTGVRIH
jgi:cytochrome P460